MKIFSDYIIKLKQLTGCFCRMLVTKLKNTKYKNLLKILLNNFDESLPIETLLVSNGRHSKINWFDHELTQMREKLKLLVQINRDNQSTVNIMSYARLTLQLQM